MKTQFEKLEIRISSPRKVIWEVISDFNKFYQWNSVVPYATGILKEGNTLKTSLKVTKNVRRSSCHVNMVSPLHYYVLSKKFIFKWLLYLEHSFIVQPIDESENEYKFVQTLETSGLLNTLVRKLLRQRWIKFHQMNRDLKNYLDKNQHYGTTKRLETN